MEAACLVLVIREKMGIGFVVSFELHSSRSTSI